MDTQNGKGPGNSKRSRASDESCQVGTLPKGAAVLFFHCSDPATKGGASLVRPTPQKTWLLQSHGWLPGVLQHPFDRAKLDVEDQNTWPLVLPKKDLVFVTYDLKGDKTGKKVDKAASGERHCLLIREAKAAVEPMASFVFVRWGGDYSKWMDEEEANDGDWGKYGSPPSDSYMSGLVEQGIAVHPSLKSKGQPDYEIFHLFVSSSKDVALIAKSAPSVSSGLKGKVKAAFWMLWPAEWEDTGDPDFACYSERFAMFTAMRATEAAGIRTAFPHPADLLEVITSKTWMATLCLNPEARLPAAAMVSRELIASNVGEAARHALQTLEHVRKICPFPCGPDEPPAPSAVNKDGIKKGMVKVGWSWENRFVLSFSTPKQLQERMLEIMTLPGSMASYCIVQEWVDFDFEMRVYFLLGSEDWAPGAVLEPRRVECNIWTSRNERATAGTPAGSFSKLSHEQAIAHWQGDTEAWEDAKKQAFHISQFCLSWLRVVNAQPVPMIRLDYMLKRLGPGKARVTFGEYCEVGACCLGWKEGPPAIWQCVLDNILRGF